MTHKYDTTFQRGLLSLLLSSREVFARVRPILRSEYFESRLGNCVDFILDYADTHNDIPLPIQILMKTGEEINLVTGAICEENLLVETETFCRYRAIENVIISGTDMLAKGQYGEIETRIKEAMTISLINDLGSDYFATVQERTERIKNRDNIVSTGWSTIDRKLYGGFTAGSLNIFAGGSGSGKSLFLQNAALNWAMSGMNVIYVTLELSEDLVGNRIDAMVSGMGTKQIYAKSDELYYRFNKAVMASKPGKLHVKKMSEAGTTANVLRAYLREYQIKFNRRPDALVVDYLDLMHPNSSRIDVTNLFGKDKYVSEELRAIAGDFGIPVLTASQLNRQSVDATEFDHSMIAGGLSKINTADNVFGIFTSRTMRESGKYQIQFLKTRSSNAVGNVVELAYDLDTMRITDFDADEIEADEEADEVAVVNSQVAVKQTAAQNKKGQLDDLLKSIRK